MELYIYDSDMTLLGIIDEIASLVWTRRYWSCGEFSLLVPMTDKHASLLKLGRIILRRDCDEAGQIRYRHIGKDADGLENVEIQGMFLTHWIGKRLIIPMLSVEAGTHELLARIVNDNLVAPDDPRRMVPNLVIGLSGVSSEPYAYTSEEFANALDVCEARAQVAKGGTGSGDAVSARAGLGITPANIGASVMDHTHALAAGSLTGILPVVKGGTGGATAAEGLANLGAAASGHGHTLSDLNGALPVAKGGTGATDTGAARSNLGVTLENLGAAASGHAHTLTDAQITGTLPLSKGGTGATDAAGARNALGLGNTTGALPISNGGTGQTTVEGTRNALGLGNTAGALPVANGGTGQTTVAAARNALGLGNTSSALPIANGGTGATSVDAARNALGLGNTSGAVPIANGGTGATSAADAVANLGYAANLVIYSASEPAVVGGKLWLKPVS